MKTYCITEFGAVGDGVTDCTAAIQNAIDQASKNPYGGEVVIPDGIFLTGCLKVHPHIVLRGAAGWSFRNVGGSVLRLNDPQASCLLDITAAFGSRISDLCIDGAHLGKNVHGIAFFRENFFDHPEEDAFCIDTTQVRDFSGDGLHLRYACCFSLRHSHIVGNRGHGIYLNSWDGFFVDNQISYNGGWGINCAAEGINNSAYTLTGNRIEWNHDGGVHLRHSRLWNITGNCFDRSGGPGLFIDQAAEPGSDGRKYVSQAVTVTGNVFNRSGADFDRNIPAEDSCHIKLAECFGVTITGNTMLVGMDDGYAEGLASPQYGISAYKIRGTVITANSMYKGYLKKDIVNLGGWADQVVIQNNVSEPVPAGDFLESGHIHMNWEQEM